MADVTRRIDRWKSKFTPARTADTLERIYDDMARRYEAATVELVAMEEQVRQVLNAAEVHTALYVPYLDFARQLYRLTRGRHISGPSFALAAQVLLEKWSARGLRPEVLASIRSDVFDIPAPSP